MTGDGPVPDVGRAAGRPSAGPARGERAQRGERTSAPSAPRRAGWSLRARLTALAAVLLALALAAGSFALSQVVSSSRIAALDEIAGDRALLVAQLARSDQVPDVLPVVEPGEVAQLLGPGGEVLASSATASRTLPVVTAAELADLRARAAEESGRGADDPGSGDLDPGADPAVAVGTSARSAYAAEVRVAAVSTVHRGEEATAVAAVPLREVQGVVGALRVSLAVVVPLLTLVAAGVIWLVLGRALRPVEDLRRGAADIARSGGPGSLPVPRAHDELGALARTLNEMLDSLRAAESRQRSFVADAAHELRSPVAALRASVEVARVHPDAYPAHELVADLEDEVVRLQRLVDDLLVLARLGARPVVHEDVDLGALAREVVDSVGAAVGAALGAAADVPTEASSAGAGAGAGADGVDPVLRVAIMVTGAGTARGERAAVGRVLRNLVDNAARHAASRVEVSVADGRVVVDDDGPGIAPADRERVFERFTRLDEARERDAGGSGLGLAIARETAREHGGDVLLADSPLGGLRAELRL